MPTPLLVKLFVRNFRECDKPQVRLALGVLAGYAGIAVNLLLFGLKLTIGILSGSIAITTDAINGLSDAGSGVVTVAGFKLSAKPADARHPFGHGRLEYVAGVVTAVFIIAVGLNFLQESLLRVFSPVKVHIDGVMLGIVAGSMIFKFWLFFFYRNIGRKIDSKVIQAAAFDSFSDIAVTATVLAAVFAARFTSFPVDGCAGALVAVMIVAGGVGILQETINPLLGETPSPSLVLKLKKELLKCPGILGVHDIILHNYGPNLYFATAHAEVNRDGELMEVHNTLESAEVTIAQKLPIRLILHCDPYNTSDPKVKLWRARTEEAVMHIDPKFKLYDFMLDEHHPHTVCFNLLVPRNYALSEEEITEKIRLRMGRFDPEIVPKITFVNAYV